MQKLNVNLSIEIPSEYVLITKMEFEDFKRNSLIGTYWNMRDLERRTGKSGVWLRENLLYPERFKKLLDAKNGGCVSYPVASGQPWVFQATRMADFLDQNFAAVFKTSI